ncbi:MAG TPA: MBL fold metallo-hydrolase [Gemmatimonadales bacterium]|nr:MBL fold metallo-hydrolase [Gemmatimonadales bacterium]
MRARTAVPILVALLAQPAAAQEPTLDSYRRARAVVESAIDALGGRAAFAALDTVRVSWTGELLNRNQSRRVDPPWDRTPNRGSLAISGARIAFEHAFSYPGGFEGWNGGRFDGTTACTVDLLRRTTGALPVAAAAGARGGMLDRFPHRHLEQALALGRGLRWAGRHDLEGRPHDLVTYAPGGRVTTLWVDAATHLPSRLDQLISDPVAGDVVTETRWPGYTRAGALQVPTGRVLAVAGDVTVDTRLEWEVGALPDSIFACPVGHDSSTPAPAQLAVRPLAERVHLVEGVAGNNALVAEFDDHLAVVEPTGDDAASRRVLAELARRFPGKPVRFIVATHHHDDHTGGLRAYMEEGVTVVTTPGNVAHFRRVAARRGTLDAVDRPVEPRFELVRGRRALGSGPGALELHDIGPNPHTEEMLVAYLPAARLVFQGDLLNADWSGRMRPGNATTVAFADWVKRSGLAVERVAGVHGPVRTRAQLEEAAALAR